MSFVDAAEDLLRELIFRDLEPDKLRIAIQSSVLEDAGDDADAAAEWLWLFEGEIERRRRLLLEMRGVVRQLRAQDVIDHGAIRLGDEAVYVGKAGKWAFADDAGADAIVDFLGSLEAVVAVFRLSADNLRIQALRAWVARISQGDAEEAEKALSGLVRWIDTGDVGELELKTLPASDRKWAAGLEHRQRKGQ